MKRVGMVKGIADNVLSEKDREVLAAMASEQPSIDISLLPDFVKLAGKLEAEVKKMKNGASGAEKEPKL